MITINTVKRKNGRIQYTGLCLSAVLLIFFILKDPQKTSESVYSAIKFCGRTMIPSLFPMMIANGIAVGSGLAELFGRLFERVQEKLFGISGITAAAFFIGILSGYPTGGLCVINLYENGMISKSDAEAAICFCNNTGISFLILGAGNMLGGTYIGLMLCAAQTAAAVTVGIIMSRIKTGGREYFEKRASAKKIEPKKPDITIFTDSVRAAVPSMLTVCGFVIFFSVFIETALSPLEAILPEAASALLYGFFEMSKGIGFAAANLPVPAAAIIVSAISGWSGISVYMQVSAFSKKHDISLKKYVISKSAMTVLCPAYSIIIGKVFSIL